jgi:hypothetical protein
MGFLKCNCGEAVNWICERFLVPSTKPGRPKDSRSRLLMPFRVGFSGSELEVLVRSGLWGQLTPAERSILPVLHIFRDTETGLARISYGAIMRYAGVGSRENVSKALRHLEQIHAIETSRTPRFGITRDVSLYRVTLESETLLRLCTETYSQSRPQVERERAMQRELRVAREKDASTRRYAGTSASPVGVTEKGGPRPPAPPAPYVPPERENQDPHPNPCTCEGLNLSSPGELQSNLSVPIGNQEINEAEWQRREQEQKARLDAWLRQRAVSERA